MNAWILAGGRLVPGPCIERVRVTHPPGLVVAADGGVRHAAVLGVRAGLWVGDFDSSDPADPAGRGAERIEFPRDKDELDAELAMQAAAARGATHFVVWGAFGGRFDHTLALVALGIEWARRGTGVLLHSGDESGLPVLAGAALDVETEPGQTLSLLALETLGGVDFDGVRWPLAGATVTPGTVRTLSNIAVARRVRLRVASGAGIVVLQHGAV